ncbi:stage II sporulation protein P [Clostridium sp. DL1XJH146]
MNRKRNIIFTQRLDYIFMVLIMFFITLVLFLFIFQRSLNYVMDNGLRRNVFYASLINETVSSIEATSFEEGANDENYLSLSNIIYTNFGINIWQPSTILVKEMAFLDGFYNGDSYERAASDEKNSNDDLDNPDTSQDDNFQLDEEDLVQKNEDEMLDAGVVFNEALVKPMSSEPQILIYHTHTCESYKPASGTSKNKEESVCAVGEELKNQLEKYGIKTIHDTTYHDVEDYVHAYSYSRDTLNSYMQQYGEFDLVIDLHRDSVEDKNSITVNLNGESCAKFMFVLTKDNPYFSTTVENVNGMIDISNELFPGISKNVLYRNRGVSFYNQDLSENALLIEVGSFVNTLDEAKNSTKYIARIIAELFNKQTE